MRLVAPLADRGFDEPKLFSAYLHTLRRGGVTATDPKLFQAPYRAGIEVRRTPSSPAALGVRRRGAILSPL